MKKRNPTQQKTKTEVKSRSSGSLEQLQKEVEKCFDCKLSKTRTHTVFGEGSQKASIVFVGEAPGEKEDLSGRPFVGRAGQLLTKMIEAMGLKREDIYICNVVKCRPPENRNPDEDEIKACNGFLLRQMQLIHPKVIVALGRFAAQTLLETDIPIGKLRGVEHSLEQKMGLQAKLIATFHPAYLLRNPPAKKDAWEDLKFALKVLGRH